MENSKWKLLDKINSPDDLKKIELEGLDSLSKEIRSFLIEKVSKTGGHLASNLGVVELTIALHRVFDTNKDKIVWDVGHQSYVHKILTGRKERFDTLRKFGGLSGFPKTKESVHDHFNTGHSSTSISAALGLARARDIQKQDHSVIAVIGDGALTGGMAFEALNDAGRSHNDIIVILNDNEMSIDRNVGGMSSYLSKIRTEPFYFKVKEDIDILLEKLPPGIRTGAYKAIGAFKGSLKCLILPGMLFEDLGFTYLGPVDGHNISHLKEVLARAKNVKGPKLIHILTQKGKGYYPAELSPHLFHGISPFEIETGELLNKGELSYSDVFGRAMCDIASKNSNVVAITAAMPHGTGLAKFSEEYPDQFFDVGIAEQHAVTFAAGLAAGGVVPVFAVYSSFLQRAYDQVSHDVATQNLHVVFAIDRAGVVGEDGETHQGVYDVSFLRHIPNISILAPADYKEFTEMLDFAVNKMTGPVAVRYPRGKGQNALFEEFESINNLEMLKRTTLQIGESFKITEGKDITILATGYMVETALKAADMLAGKGIFAEVIDARFIKPLDVATITKSVQKTKRLITIEDNSICGGFGSSVCEMLSQKGITDVKVKLMGLPDKFIEHASRNEIFNKYGLLPTDIYDTVIEFFNLNIDEKKCSEGSGDLDFEMVV